MPQAETTNPFLRMVDALDPEDRKRILFEFEEDKDVTNAASRILDELEAIREEQRESRREQTAIMVAIAELRSQSPIARIDDHENRLRCLEKHIERKRDAIELAERESTQNRNELTFWRGRVAGFGGAAALGAAALGLILKLLGVLS